MVSFVWEYFKQNPNQPTAKCCKCSVDIFSKGATTTMIRHLRDVHSIRKKEEPESETDQDEQPPRKKFKQSELSFSTKQYNSDLPFAELVSKDGIPASKILSSRIIKKGLEADGVKVPKSHSTVMKRVHDFYKAKENELKLRLKVEKSAGKKWSISFDEWTSLRGRRYLNINLHDCDTAYCLGMIRVFGSLTAERTDELLRNKLMEFDLDLDSDIICAIGDGAKVNEKFGRNSQTEFQTCLNHGLHLAVHDVLYKKQNLREADSESDSTDQETDNEVDDEINEREFLKIAKSDMKLTIAAVRQIVKLFKYSDLRNQVLQEAVCDTFGHEIQLVLDVKTR